MLEKTFQIGADYGMISLKRRFRKGLNVVDRRRVLVKTMLLFLVRERRIPRRT